MNRREFLKLLGIGAAGMAAPKIIFDMGKNSAIYTPEVIMKPSHIDFNNFKYEIKQIAICITCAINSEHLYFLNESDLCFNSEPLTALLLSP